VIAGGAAIWWTRDAESAASETLVGDTTQLPTTVASVPPATAPTVPTVPTKRTKTTTTPRPSDRRHLIEWPKGRSGWMLVLSSLPTSAGREAAVAKARRALAAGLPQVGVLDSSRYSSLHPGYFVVFSGIYATLREAQDAASKAASSGYNAYPRRVTS
jgi:cell division septation protein DedD